MLYKVSDANNSLKEDINGNYIAISTTTERKLFVRI